MNGSQEGGSINRRDLLVGAGVGALTFLGATEAQAGMWQEAMKFLGLGGNSREELEKEFHAAEVYMKYKEGALRHNFEKLQEIGKAMRAGELAQMSDKERRAYLDGAIRPIIEEKNSLLASYDKDLIPMLLVEYVQNGLENKSLVQVYGRLGGDIERVRSEGIKGINLAVTQHIASYMTYDLQTNRASGYGDVTYSSLSFIGKPNLKK